LSASVRLCFLGAKADLQILKELLSPWEVSFTDLEQADVVINCDFELKCNKKSIVIPRESPDFRNRIKKYNLRLTDNHEKLLRIDVSERTCLSIRPQKLYNYESTQTSRSHKFSPTVFSLNSQMLMLKLDITREFESIVNLALFRKPSQIYNLLTGLPISYDLAPKSVRNIVLGNRKSQGTINYGEKLPLDALRFILVKAIERLLGKNIERKKWKGANCCCLVTHDIDTAQGLGRASSVRKLEEKYNLQSTWYIPSKHYPLNSMIVQELANHGEMGVHGAKHAGNLVRLSGPKLFSQLLEAKKHLERISHHAIHGFRSPLLQHNSVLLDQLKRVGYAYDTSIPTWEPRHPQTMSSFGIGTVFPLHLRGLMEIPVSIIQDHQLLYVLGLKPKEALSQWLLSLKMITDIGGCSVLLSHPEYKLFDSENLPLYEEFLNAATADKQIWFSTPNEISSRSGSQVSLTSKLAYE
jgi:peptidoglycan/xylan/chitin deacetylase (PgdA/CDA1 family)